MKTLKGGGWDIPISPDGKFIFTIGQNKVYVHGLPDLKKTEVFKTLPNIINVTMSHNGKYLAAKNTSGKIAVLEYPAGKILGTCAMEKSEGYNSICFSPDDTYILDFDWNGNIMQLDISTVNEVGEIPLKLKHKVLHRIDKSAYENRNLISFIGYCDSKNEFFIIDCGFVHTSPIENINFKAYKKTIHAYLLQQNVFIGKKYNALHDKSTIYLFNKSWDIVNVLTPKRLTLNPKFGNINFIHSVALSDNGEMLFVRYAEKSYLFETDTMEPVWEWSGGMFSSGARFINNDTMIAVSGWSRTVVEKIQRSVKTIERVL